VKPLAECLLYTFVDTAYLRDRKAEDVCAALCEGGSDLVQFRAKNLDVREIQKISERLAVITRRCGVALVVNDYPEIAAAVGAEFCHLGQEDFFDQGYTQLGELRVSGTVRVGLSSHAPAQAERAVRAGAAYIAVGPVYATATKTGRPAVTLEYVRWAAAHLRIPWFAIGGINLDNLEEVVKAGARRICMVSAILNAPDIAKACQVFKERLLSASRSS
jgi:thiamine-phosphate pyrophosphorylase